MISYRQALNENGKGVIFKNIFKMKKTFYLTLSLIAIIGISSCKDDTGVDPAPTTKADIVGRVNLYNEGVIPMDNSGMKVSLEGVTPEIFDITNAEGKFVLADVPFGTYTLIFDKSGYGTFKKFELQHIYTGFPTFISSSPSLGQEATTTITGLNVVESNDAITVSTTMSPEANIGNTRYLRYFFSTEETVSNENFDAVLETLQAQITPYDLNLNRSTLGTLGFSSGQTVYVKCYGESFWSNQYDDPNLGTTVFPNLNPASADAMSFVVP